VASYSNYLENAVLNWLFNQTPMTLSSVYVALYTSAPSDNGGGTEVSGNNYARAEVATTNTNFLPATNGTIKNALTINFNVPSGNWGTVTHIGLFDSATGGNLLMWAPLQQSRVVTTGSTVNINQNQLTISQD
jgi:hypothetical protein